MTALKYIGLVILGMLLWSVLLNSYLYLKPYLERVPAAACTQIYCLS